MVAATCPSLIFVFLFNNDVSGKLWDMYRKDRKRISHLNKTRRSVKICILHLPYFAWKKVFFASKTKVVYSFYMNNESNQLHHHNKPSSKFREQTYWLCGSDSEVFLQESILIAFDFIWIVLFSNWYFATLLDRPLLLNLPWEPIIKECCTFWKEIKHEQCVINH